jgi:hypothetical protein
MPKNSLSREFKFNGVGKKSGPQTSDFDPFGKWSASVEYALQTTIQGGLLPSWPHTTIPEISLLPREPLLRQRDLCYPSKHRFHEPMVALLRRNAK